MTIGLIQARAAFGPVMAFLFTSPLLNPIVVIVFYITFGLKITVIYALTALFASLSAGYILEKFGFEKYIKKEKLFPEFTPNTTPINNPILKQNISFTDNNASCCKKDETSKSKYIKLLKNTWKQFLSFVPYIAMGIAIGAFVHGFVPQDLITQYANKDNILAVPISAIIGIPLYIRASMMVGLGPELIANGVNLGSILALTIAGAGASLPEMIMLKKIFKLPIMIFFLVSVFTMAIGCGYIVNMYFA